MNALARGCSIAVLVSGLALGAEVRKPTSLKGGTAAMDKPPIESPLQGKQNLDASRIRPGQQPPGRTGPGRACFCCIDGDVSLLAPAVCGQRSGTCHQGSKDEVEQQCKGRCWCCAGDQVSLVEKADCRARSGECAGTAGDAEDLCKVQPK
jgi:hypothetical protein